MSKRGGIFEQGRREEEMDELNARPGDGIDPVKRATAAQLAGRKIKAPKSRLNQSTSSSSFAGGNSSAPSNAFAPVNFSATAPTSFNFGGEQQSAPSAGGFGAPNAPSNFTFGGANAATPSANPFSFGSPNVATTNAPAAPVSFGGQQQNSSVGGFGGSTPSTTFNFGNTDAASSGNTASPFNFGNADTASTGNAAAPFNFGAQPSTPSAGGFGSGSNNLFGTGVASQTPAGGSSNLFNFQPQTSTPSAGGMSSKRRLPNKRGVSPAKSPAPSPAPSNPFGGLSSGTFGANNASASTPASNNLFATASFPAFGSNNAGSEMATSPEQNNSSVSASFPPFGGNNAAAAPAASTPTPNNQPAAPLFSFGGGSTGTSTAPQSETFSKSAFPAFGANSNATAPPAGNMFSQSVQPAFGSGAQQNSVAPSNNLFASPLSQAGTTGAQKSSNPFQFLQAQAQPTEKPSAEQTEEATPKPKSTLFSFGQSQPAEKPSTEQTEEATPKPKGTLFSFGQSQSAAAASSPAEQPKAAEQPKTNGFSFGQSAPTNAAASEPSPAPAQAQRNPFGSVFLQANTGDKVQEESQAAGPPTQPPATKETATEPSQQQGESASATTSVPNIPKAYVPPTWKNAKPSAEGVPHPSQLSELDTRLVDLAAELATLNRKFQEKIAKVPVMADWTALSRWHLKESKAIMASIVQAKKERARRNGVTGDESALSTKRKATEGSETEPQVSTPAKKPRAEATSESSLFSFTPKTAPPQPTQASNPFSSTPKANSASQPSNPFAKLNTPATSGPAQESPKPPGGSLFRATSEEEPRNAGITAFAPKNTFSPAGFKTSSSDSAAKTSASPSGFKVPTASSTANDSASPAGFKVPAFGTSSAQGSSGASMINAFAKKAKTAEELTAERKAKAKDEDYDSDEEPYEEWSARWDREEAARKEEEAKKAQASKGFTATGLGASGSGAKSPFTVSKPASGSTSLFASRGGSPAPAASGALSVFGTPSAAPSPSSNIFGHLSSATSSNNQDDTDDEEEEQEEGEDQEGQEEEGESDGATPKPAGSKDASDTEEENVVPSTEKQYTATSKPSLLSRVSFAPANSEESADKSKTGDDGTAPKTNGSFETPQKKFNFFDFTSAAGPQTAPPKSTFAGDQTFKPGTPIKFGTSTPESGSASSKPVFNFQSATPPSDAASKPLFSFQAPTPSSNDAGAKPAPFSFLGNSTSAASKPSWLAPNTNQSGPASGASSVFSSRAATPLSDAGASEKGSTAGKAGEDEEETSKAAQLDLSVLTEEEEKDYDVLFQSPQAIAKQQAGEGANKTWKNFARGPLWILKNKETGKALVRMRIPSGATPVNFNILPKLASTVAGNSKTMILVYRPGAEGKIESVYLVVKTKEQAEDFSQVYNKNMPSA